MKNPFIQMAIMAAAMTAAFKENTARDAGVNIPSFDGHFGRGVPGPRNPAGTKLIRKFYRNKHGVKADRDEAVKWYSLYRSRT